MPGGPGAAKAIDSYIDSMPSGVGSEYLIMKTDTDDVALAKRRLILHDTLAFLSLALVTVVLFAVTLLLFRSFEAHRADLAKRWSDRGEAALKAGKPDQAIGALRTALYYAPSQRSYELLLAQALGDAGDTEEAYNYFVGLWETEPGSGFINLQLARLEAKKKNAPSAVHYYHASIYGTWEGDGILRRRDVRLELARYLISQHDLATARTELLIAGGNAPDNLNLDITLGGLLQQAGDPTSALSYYQKAIAKRPNNQVALEQAGRLAYELGDYSKAHRLLERAIREHNVHQATTPELQQDTIAMLGNSERLMNLQPSRTLRSAERVARILTARAIARKRLNSCLLQSPAATAALQNLNTRWAGPDAKSGRAALREDDTRQDSALQLIYDTEVQTSQVCGAPTGDDALLLLLAKSPEGAQQ